MMVARTGKGQLGIKTKPENAQAEGRQSAGRLEMLVWPKGASRPDVVQRSRISGPWAGAGIPGPSRSQSRAGISAGPHVHFSLPCRVRASGDANPLASSCLVHGTATGLWGDRLRQTLGPRAGTHSSSGNRSRV